MIAVQSKSPSLAGLLTNVNVLIGQILSNPKVLTSENLVKLSVSSTPIFINLGTVELLSADQNATNIDASSRLMPFYIPQLQGCTGDSHSAQKSAQCGDSEHRLNICPMFDSSYPTLQLSKQCRNRDLYGEFAGDILKSQDIEKGSISSAPLSERFKWDCHYHLDNNADAKIITAAYCQKLGKKKSNVASVTLSTTANGYQPFGSMPKRSSSLRPSVLSQLARLIPEAEAADSNCSLSSGVILILNCGDCPSPLGLLSRFIIDGWSPIKLISLAIGGHNSIGLLIKTMPRSAPTLTGHLTTNVIYSNEEAMQENTTPAQGRHSLNLNSGNEQTSFVWIIAAIRRDCPTIKATIHHIAASTEREARLSLVKDHVCFFAGRINQAVSHV